MIRTFPAMPPARSAACGSGSAYATSLHRGSVSTTRTWLIPHAPAPITATRTMLASHRDAHAQQQLVPYVAWIGERTAPERHVPVIGRNVREPIVQSRRHPVAKVVVNAC